MPSQWGLKLEMTREKELVAAHRVKKSGGGAATIAQAEIREQRLRNALQT